MALTRTPGPSSGASCLVRWISADFVTSYTPSIGLVLRPPTDEMLITTPPCSCMWRCQANWVQISGAVRLTSKVFSQRGRSTSIVRPAYGLVPALLTRMSTPPS